MDNPAPPPASGSIILQELREVGQKLDGLITAIQAMKREQERLNAIVTQRPHEREVGGREN